MIAGRSGRLMQVVLLLVASLWVVPGAQADGGGEPEMIREVDGYKIGLVFSQEPSLGENKVSVIVEDHQQRGVGAASVMILVRLSEQESSARAEDTHPVEGSESIHDTDGAKPDDHDDDPASEIAHDDADASNSDEQHASDEHTSAETGRDQHPPTSYVLEAGHAIGEFEGLVVLETAGAWELIVILEAEGKRLEALFPVHIEGRNVRGGILAAILGINLAIIAAAAVVKPRSAQITKNERQFS